MRRRWSGILRAVRRRRLSFDKCLLGDDMVSRTRCFKFVCGFTNTGTLLCGNRLSMMKW